MISTEKEKRKEKTITTHVSRDDPHSKIKGQPYTEIRLTRYKIAKIKIIETYFRAFEISNIDIRGHNHEHCQTKK